MATELESIRAKMRTEVKRLEVRLASAETRIALLEHLAACDDCGAVFKDRDAWAHHLCPGKQGR